MKEKIVENISFGSLQLTQTTYGCEYIWKPNDNDPSIRYKGKFDDEYQRADDDQIVGNQGDCFVREILAGSSSVSAKPELGQFISGQRLTAANSERISSIIMPIIERYIDRATWEKSSNPIIINVDNSDDPKNASISGYFEAYL